MGQGVNHVYIKGKNWWKGGLAIKHIKHWSPTSVGNMFVWNCGEKRILWVKESIMFLLKGRTGGTIVHQQIVGGLGGKSSKSKTQRYVKSWLDFQPSE